MIIETMIARIHDQEQDGDHKYKMRVWTANRCYTDSITGTRTALDAYYGALDLVFGEFQPDDLACLVLGGIAVRYRDIEAIEVWEDVPGDW